MVHSLNLVVENKGVTVKSIIITNVELPKDIAEMLEEKTTYQSKNNLEINRHRFQLLVREYIYIYIFIDFEERAGDRTD